MSGHEYYPADEPREPSRKRHFKDWIDLGALAVAVVVAVVTICQWKEKNKNDRLMARPYMSVVVATRADGISLTIANEGLGPALIHVCEPVINGHIAKDKEAVLKFLAPFFDVTPLINLGALKSRGAAMSVGGRREILLIQPKPAREIPAGVTLRLCYCSIYEDCWMSKTGGFDKVSSCE